MARTTFDARARARLLASLSVGTANAITGKHKEHKEEKIDVDSLAGWRESNG
jgi:hypothetical protein